MVEADIEVGGGMEQGGMGEVGRMVGRYMSESCGVVLEAVRNWERRNIGEVDDETEDDELAVEGGRDVVMR